MKPVEPRIYRATLESWVGQLLLPLIFFVLLIISMVNVIGLHLLIGSVGITVLCLVFTLEYLLPMARNWVRLDARTIEGSLNGRYFDLYWNEILAAWLFERGQRRFLCLGTRDGTLVLPLRFFNECGVWEQVQQMVPAEALEDTAMQCLPDYRDWETAREEALAGVEPRAVTDHWLMQVAGWAGLVCSVWGGIHSGFARMATTALFLGLGGGCLFLLLNWGLTEFGAAMIERYTLFGGWSIGWDEIRSIEFGPLDLVIVLVGADRQMVIPGPVFWGGAGKKEALTMLLAQMERRRILLRRTPWALLKVSRKTRVQK